MIETEQEIWKPIPNFKGYEVSNLGKVRSFWRTSMVRNKYNELCGKNVFIGNEPKILKPQFNTDGYYKFTLKKNESLKSKLAHRLVMESFYEPSVLEVNHKNGVKTDNRIENLEYVTHKENMSHAKDSGFMENLYSSCKKISDHEINIIRNSTISNNYLAKIFHTTEDYIQDIKSKRARRRVLEEILIS